jgi:hypothetical protein
MAISQACPFPPASGLLGTTSFADSVSVFFINRLTITVREEEKLKHHFQDDQMVSLTNYCSLNSDLPPIKYIKQFFLDLS